MKRTEQVGIDLETSTLGELRQALAALEQLPDSAMVRVRTRFGANAHGALLRRLSVVDDAAQPGRAWPPP